MLDQREEGSRAGRRMELDCVQHPYTLACTVTYTPTPPWEVGKILLKERELYPEEKKDRGQRGRGRWREDAWSLTEHFGGERVRRMTHNRNHGGEIGKERNACLGI